MTTGAVVALKPFAQAKSRLRGLPDPVRQRLAWCLAADTLAALAAAVDRLIVVSDEPELARRLHPWGPTIMVVAEGGTRGINAAMQRGDAALRDAGVELVIGCVGDLPCLRARSVQRAITAASAWPRSFLPDARGSGTTMLLARATPLHPQFQGASAAAHLASGAAALAEALTGPIPDARHDVDTEDDLRSGWSLGLGPATAGFFDSGGRLGHYGGGTVLGETGSGDYVVIMENGHRARTMIDAPRAVRAGQPVHLITSAQDILSAWC